MDGWDQGMGGEVEWDGRTYAYVNPTAFVMLNTSASMTIGMNLSCCYM